MGEFWFQPDNGFWDVIRAGFEQAPIAVGGRLIPDVQAPGMGGERRPDIAVGQAATDLPGFVEERDGAIGLNAANEMNAAGGQRQRVGDLA